MLFKNKVKIEPLTAHTFTQTKTTFRKYLGQCLVVSAFTCQMLSANAALLTNEFSNDLDAQLQANGHHLDLTLDSSTANTTQSTFAIDFKKQGFSRWLSDFKKTYLTFYTNKNKTLDASYTRGAYYIKYTHNWK